MGSRPGGSVGFEPTVRVCSAAGVPRDARCGAVRLASDLRSDRGTIPHAPHSFRFMRPEPRDLTAGGHPRRKVSFARLIVRTSAPQKKSIRPASDTFGFEARTHMRSPRTAIARGATATAMSSSFRAAWPPAGSPGTLPSFRSSRTPAPSAPCRTRSGRRTGGALRPRTSGRRRRARSL